MTFTSTEGKKGSLLIADPLQRTRVQIEHNKRVVRSTGLLRNLCLSAAVIVLLITMNMHSIGLFIVTLFLITATITFGVMNRLARKVLANLSLGFSRAQAFGTRNLRL